MDNSDTYGRSLHEAERERHAQWERLAAERGASKPQERRNRLTLRRRLIEALRAFRGAPPVITEKGGYQPSIAASKQPPTSLPAPRSNTRWHRSK